MISFWVYNAIYNKYRTKSLRLVLRCCCAFGRSVTNAERANSVARVKYGWTLELNNPWIISLQTAPAVGPLSGDARNQCVYQGCTCGLFEMLELVHLLRGTVRRPRNGALIDFSS